MWRGAGFQATIPSMARKPEILLTREVRLAVTATESEPGTANNFSANPPPDGIVPVVALRVQIAGAVDPDSGMLVNIKHIDQMVRRVAAPAMAEMLRADIRAIGPGVLLTELFQRCSAALAPHPIGGLTLNVSPWMYFQACEGELPMIRLAQRFEFSAAHRLDNPALTVEKNLELFGKCNNPNGHGHNYELEVLIGGEPDPHSGHIMPLAEFQRLINQHVIDMFDHKHLNLDCPEFAKLNPTVENIAQVIFRRIQGVFPAHVKLLAVKVWETPKTCCEVRCV
jgi:6-pyruvoyltetrahydropterin/6-carboxytetrahydropterin synthase